MGQLTDTLRATLRDLAQADARLYRGLQEELGDNGPASPPAPAQLEGDAPASRQELEALSVAALWGLCKARGIKGLSKGPVAKQVEALLGHPEGPPLRSSLPAKAVRGSRGAAGGGKSAPKSTVSELRILEQRLDRLEQWLLLIAEQVGVPQEAIKPLLLAPASPEARRGGG